MVNYQASEYEGNHNGYEVFWVGNDAAFEDSQGTALERGWYWWSCQPGCLPDGDGDPSGPFDTSKEAYDDAHQDDAGQAGDICDRRLRQAGH